MSRTQQQPLADQHVWLARPAHQAAGWAASLEAAGARVTVRPLIGIVPPTNEAAARRALAAAEQADIVLATSPNAVRGAWRLRPNFAPSGQLLAVGDGTTRWLQQAAGRAVTVPGSRDTSEGLLELPELARVAGLTVVLLSGQGGRRELQQTLARRGAHVHKIVLYRREKITMPGTELAALVNGHHAAVVTSGEAVQHLCIMLQACDRGHIQPGLERLQLVVPSPRVVKLVPEALFRRPARAAARMTADAVVSALASADKASGTNHF